MTNKQHNQQLGIIDAHLRNLEYELINLSKSHKDLERYDEAKLALDTVRSLIRQFQL